MEPVTLAAAVAAYKGAKSAVSAINDLMETAESVGELAGHLNKVFHLRDTAEKHTEEATVKKEPTKLQRILRQRTGDNSESETTFANVAAAELAKREHETMITQLAISIDAKFGHGTFKQIELAHARAKAKKIKAKREAAALREKEEAEARARYKKYFIEAGKFLAVAGVRSLMAFMLFNAYEQGPIR